MLLLTGLPGVGKTTVIRRLAAALAGKRLGGQERIIAHVDVPKRQRVGKYGVDVFALDELAGSALAPDPAVAVYLVDEIGKMECLSPRFVAALRALLADEQTVVASVALKGGGLIDEVKQRKDALLWEVTRENRDRLPGRILAWLEGIGP